MNIALAGLCLLFLCLYLSLAYRPKVEPAKSNIDYTGWKFLVTYKRGNREPWALIIGEGSSLKTWIKRHREEYGFDVEILTTKRGTELRVDTHGLAGWERKEAI